MMKTLIYGGTEHRLVGVVIADITMKDINPETGEREGEESVHYHPDLTEEEKEGVRLTHPFARNFPEV